FALPIATFFVWTHRRELADVRLLLLAMAALALPLFLYLYLPLSRATVYGWGDLRTVRGFLAHVSRADYGTFHLSGAGGAPSAADVAGSFAGEAIRAVAFIGVIPMLAGAAHRPTRSILWPAFAFYLAVFLAAANLPLD